MLRCDSSRRLGLAFYGEKVERRADGRQDRPGISIDKL